MTPNEALQAAKDALDKALVQKQMNQELIKSLGPAIIDALKPVLQEVADNSKVTKDELQAAIAGIQITVPKADVPQAEVKVTIPDIVVPQPNVTIPPIKIPEIKIPKIVVPKPEVTVNVPPIKIPKLEWPTEKMPIEGWVSLMGVDLQHPLPVHIVNAKDIVGGGSTILGGSGGGGIVQVSGVLSTVGVVTINPDGNPTYTTSAAGGGATTVALVNVDGTYYNSDNPLPVTGSFSTTPSPQVSGYADSVNVMQYGGVATPSGLNETTAGVFRTVQMTDSVSSVYVTGAAASTFAEVMNPDGYVKTQINGLFSAVAGSGGAEGIANALRVVIASDSISSVSISGAVASTFSELLNPDGRVKSEISTIAGLNETNTGVIRVVQMTDSVSSVVVNSGTITTVSTVTGVTNTVNVRLDSPDGIITAANPLPVTIISDALNLDQTTDSIAVRQVSGSIDSVNVVTFNGNAPATGLNETNSGVLRTVQMTDSVASVVVNSGTITTVSTVTGVTNTVNVRLDSPDGLYSTANPLPTTLVSGALTSTIAVGAVVAGAADDGSAPIKVGGIARTANPAAVTGGQQVSFSADKIGRQINRPVQVRDLIATAYLSLANGTETTLLAAGGTGVFLDCISVICSNSSDAAVMVDFRAVTGGNIEFSIEVPASGPGGIAHPVPWPQSATNNNWTADMPDITGTTVNISALFSKEI